MQLVVKICSAVIGHTRSVTGLKIASLLCQEDRNKLNNAVGPINIQHEGKEA